MKLSVLKKQMEKIIKKAMPAPKHEKIVWVGEDKDKIDASMKGVIWVYLEY